MERRAYQAPLDPALAVSGLLTRLGLFLLVVFSPFVAMFSRRAVAVMVPIATALLILAAALDGRLLSALRRLGRSLLSSQTLALFLILIWASITILWTPKAANAAGRLPRILLTVLLFSVAIACLKYRARLSDVYLIPIGVGIASVTLALQFLPHSPLAQWVDTSSDDTESLRAAILLTLLIWPAAGALMARGRNWQALVLCLVTILSLWLVRNLVVFAAFIVGTLVMLAALWRPHLTARVVRWAVIALLVLAPAIGWLMSRYGGFLLPAEGDQLVGIWRDVTYAIPGHLFGGFGYDSSAWLTRGVGGQLLASPRNAALQIWLELGIVGVALSALALWAAFRAVEERDERSIPAALATGAAATVMMFSGLAAWQIWWLMSLGLTSVSLAFFSRLGTRRIG